jgi:hypothetical protein
MYIASCGVAAAAAASPHDKTIAVIKQVFFVNCNFLREVLSKRALSNTAGRGKHRIP